MSRNNRIAALILASAYGMLIACLIYQAKVATVLFWSSAYQREYYAESAQWDIVDNGYVFTPRNFEGYWITVHDGYRVTVGQPHVYSYTIWLFGSSTMFSSQVPNASTIASFLQSELPQVRVVNVGMNGASIANEVARLAIEPIRRGDTVVFYDGEADAFGVVNGVDADHVAKGYRAHIAQARNWTLAHGALFYHVLQPQPYSIDPPPDFPLGDKEQHGFDSVWPMLEHSETGINLTHVLDKARMRGSVFYFEGAHINAVGNAIVAHAIANVILSW